MKKYIITDISLTNTSSLKFSHHNFALILKSYVLTLFMSGVTYVEIDFETYAALKGLKTKIDFSRFIYKINEPCEVRFFDGSRCGFEDNFAYVALEEKFWDLAPKIKAPVVLLSVVRDGQCRLPEKFDCAGNISLVRITGDFKTDTFQKICNMVPFDFCLKNNYLQGVETAKEALGLGHSVTVAFGGANGITPLEEVVTSLVIQNKNAFSGDIISGICAANQFISAISDLESDYINTITNSRIFERFIHNIDNEFVKNEDFPMHPDFLKWYEPPKKSDEQKSDLEFDKLFLSFPTFGKIGSVSDFLS